MSLQKVSVNQLQVGVFVELEIPWYKHPFLTNSFKISKPEQIQVIRGLNIKTITVNPDKSDKLPLSVGEKTDIPPTTDSAATNAVKAMWFVKKRRIERYRQYQQELKETEQTFQKNISNLKVTMKNIENATEASYEEAEKIVQSLVDDLMPQRQMAIQLMTSSPGTENAYFHSLNTAVLSLMIGTQCGFDEHQLKELALGALFHDIGKTRIPKNILNKTSPLKGHELKLYELHPAYGVDLLSKIYMLPGVMQIVYQHHEAVNGSGYPKKLKKEEISKASRIVSIANVYDNLCNKLDFENALTPYEAMSYMFKKMRHKLDEEILALFIKSLGMYPPGSIVALSDNRIGIVMASNPDNLLRPDVLVYDPDIPKMEAVAVRLEEEEEIAVKQSIRPAKLPQAVYEYLSPRKKITYYSSSHGKDR